MLNALTEEVKANPEATLDHLRHLLKTEFTIDVSNATIYRALKGNAARRRKSLKRSDLGRSNKASA